MWFCYAMFGSGYIIGYSCIDPYRLTYRQTSNIRNTLVGKEIIVHSDVVGASPVCAAPTTSSLLT